MSLYNSLSSPSKYLKCFLTVSASPLSHGPVSAAFAPLSATLCALASKRDLRAFLADASENPQSKKHRTAISNIATTALLAITDAK